MWALQIVPAEYAFVLHTANLVTGERGELFVVCKSSVGMGEALVGNHPGRALSFRSASDGHVEVRASVKTKSRFIRAAFRSLPNATKT
jgi:alpha-glucan,water dikinase